MLWSLKKKRDYLSERKKGVLLFLWQNWPVCVSIQDLLIYKIRNITFLQIVNIFTAIILVWCKWWLNLKAILCLLKLNNTDLRWYNGKLIIKKCVCNYALYTDFLEKQYFYLQISCIHLHGTQGIYKICTPSISISYTPERL